ncbi:MAG: hypothetical protein H6667_14360 [Ardenticatenaceae bacterium]|nr:hypothetical protein [Ardenticatenaceae bacterium]
MSGFKVNHQNVKLFLMFWLLSSLLGCASFQSQPTTSEIETIEPIPTPSLPSDVFVVENSGEICFKNCERCRSLEATFTPSGCFSSACTRDLSHFGEVNVNEESFTIQFITRYEAFDPYGPQPEDDERGWHTCTTDCKHMNSIQFWIGVVPQGTYSIWLGDDHLGDIPVPTNIPGLEPICFKNAIMD